MQTTVPYPFQFPFMSTTQLSTLNSLEGIQKWIEMRPETTQFSLFILEVVLLCILAPFQPLLIVKLVKRKAYHRNFRFILIVTTMCLFIITIDRLVFVLQHIEFIDPIAFFDWLHRVIIQIKLMYRFGFVMLIIERSFATNQKGGYDENCGNMTVMGGYLIGMILPSALFGVLFVTVPSNIRAYCTLCSYTLPPIIIFPFFVLLKKRNNQIYDIRLEKCFDLLSKYQISENIRASAIILPIAINNMLSMVAYILLISYSIFLTNVPLGHDNGPITHVYNMLVIYDYSFFVGSLLYSMKTVKRDVTPFQKNKNRKKEADEYFESLELQWA